MAPPITQTSLSWSMTLILSFGLCLLALSFVRAFLDVKQGVDITERYTAKRLVSLFILIPLLCGAAAFFYIQLVPQHRHLLPLLFFGILLASKLAMWRPRRSVDASFAGQAASPEQNVLTKEQRAQQIRRISVTSLVLTSLIVLVTLAGLAAFVQQRPVVGLLLVSLSIPLALRCLNLARRLSEVIRGKTNDALG
jgi:hypothetical protein